MKKNRGFVAIIGFLLAGTGFLSIIVGLVGLKLAVVAWADYLPSPFGFLIKIILILAGLVIMYLALTDSSKEDMPV